MHISYVSQPSDIWSLSVLLICNTGHAMAWMLAIGIILIITFHPTLHECSVSTMRLIWLRHLGNIVAFLFGTTLGTNCLFASRVESKYSKVVSQFCFWIITASLVCLYFPFYSDRFTVCYTWTVHVVTKAKYGCSSRCSYNLNHSGYRSLSLTTWPVCRVKWEPLCPLWLSRWCGMQHHPPRVPMCL